MILVDTFAAYLPIFSVLLVLILGVLIYRFNKRLIKGWLGEFSVNLSTRYFLDKKVYHLLKNVTLPTEDESTQIDHIIVSRFGVFVVETKNMKGWIFGREDEEQWTQQIYKHGNQFQNPLHQNYKHAKALEEIFGLRPETIFPVIVFVGDSELKTTMPENVTNTRGYLGYIKSKQEPLFGPFEVEELVEKIEKYRLETGLKTNLTHIRNQEKDYPKKIRRKLKRAKPTPKIYRYTVFAAVLLLFWGAAKNSVFEKRDETETQQTELEESAARKEINKIYKIQDSQGRTQYTNVAASPDAQLLDEEGKVSKTSLPVEIIDNKVVIPVTISNNETQLHTSLILDRNSNKTIIPMRIADFLEAEDLSVTGNSRLDGKVVDGEMRRISQIKIGSVSEENFVFLASDTQLNNQRGILGMDFIVKHPFIIDTEQKLLLWK